jgi:FMNH2-dependent dimethyl sulfone monooxygenase
MATEFTEMLERLWREDANVTWNGDHWSLHNAYVSPKPTHGRPIMVSAGSSDAGLAYATQYSDLIFITSPGGADIGDALATLPAHTKHIRDLAATRGRSIRTVINPHVICRETEREVEEVCRAIVAAEDTGAVDGLMGTMTSGDQSSWRGHKRDQRIIGGNVHVFGTPEQVTEQFLKLKQAGCDGVQINFFDFAPDLEFLAPASFHSLRKQGSASIKSRAHSSWQIPATNDNSGSAPSCVRSVFTPVPGDIRVPSPTPISTSPISSDSRKSWKPESSTPFSWPIISPSSTCRWKH